MDQTEPPIVLEQLVYTWAERTLSDGGHGVVLRSSGWPTSNSVATDATLSRLVEYVPQNFLLGISETVRPPRTVGFWALPQLGNVVVVRQYLGNDSAGRGGRSISHVLLDRASRLTASSALELALSTLIVSDWPLAADPVAKAAPAEFSPQALSRCESTVDRGRLAVVCAGLFEVASSAARVVFTQHGNDDTAGLLCAALRLLPRELTNRITFSTYHAQPARSPAAITFAAASFSEVKPLTDRSTVYVDLDAPAADDSDYIGRAALSTASRRLAGEIVALEGGESVRYPTGISTPEGLDSWLRFRHIAARDASTLALGECVALLRLPSGTSWLDRQTLITRVGVLTRTQPLSATDAEVLRGILTEPEREYVVDGLHRRALDEVSASPDRVQRTVDEASRLGGDPHHFATRAAPILVEMFSSGRRPVDGSLDAIVADAAAQLSFDEQLSWADNPQLQWAVLGVWNPIASAVALRTWSIDGWAARHPRAAVAVADRYGDQSAAMLTSCVAKHQTSLDTVKHVLTLDERVDATPLVEIGIRAVETKRLPARFVAELAQSHELSSEVRARLSAAAPSAVAGIRYVESRPSIGRPEPYAPVARSVAPIPWQNDDEPNGAKAVGRRGESRWPDSGLLVLGLLSLVAALTVGFAIAASNWSLFVWPIGALVLAVGSLSIIGMWLRARR